MTIDDRAISKPGNAHSAAARLRRMPVPRGRSKWNGFERPGRTNTEVTGAVKSSDEIAILLTQLSNGGLIIRETGPDEHLLLRS